jgi:hypothetical protein
VQGGGIQGVAQGLFAESFGLQVTPRRRLTSKASNLIAAGATGTIQIQTPFTADVLNANDGLLFDLIMLTVTASAIGTTVTAAEASLAGPSFSGLPLPAQPVFTLGGISAGSNFIGLLTPSPALLTMNDLDFLFAGGAPPIPQLEPTTIAVQVALLVNNPTAGAITVTAILNAMVRIVRGLQEG